MNPNPNNPRIADRVRPDATAASLDEVVRIVRRWNGGKEMSPR